LRRNNGKSFPGTPEPDGPDRWDAFDGWQFDRPFKQGQSPQAILAGFVEPESATGIQGKHSYAVPRREVPEWAYFDSFLQILIAQYGENPAEVAMRAACPYLAYRAGYTDAEIAEYLSGEVLYERKGAVTEGQVTQCLWKAANRAEEIWPTIKTGLRKEGMTVAEKMLQRFLKSKMHCMPKPRWEPQRTYPLHGHTLNAHDSNRAYGCVEFEFVRAIDEETGREFEKAIRTLTHPDPVASKAITTYGDTEAKKFGTTTRNRWHRVHGKWPVVPMELQKKPMESCVLWTFSDTKRAWRSKKDTNESLRKQLGDSTLAVDSKKRFKSREWQDELPRGEDDESLYGQTENDPEEQNDDENEYEDAEEVFPNQSVKKKE
jgi:hypothetical protein